MINFYHILAAHAHPDIEPERMLVENKFNARFKCAQVCFKDQAEVVVAQEEVQEKIDLVENEEELIEEEEQ
nr:hypothetical protein [Tanacetum cinerariifolium]